MTARQYRGVDIERTPSGGWWIAHVPVPNCAWQSYSIVRADTLEGIRGRIADVLDGASGYNDTRTTR